MCKRAVLVIHGFGGSIIETEEFINYVKLNTNYDVYGFTLPGHEKAIVSNVKYKDWIDASIEQVEVLLTKYKKIYLVGHSMGGVIASYLATKYKQINKLVLIAPAFMYVNIKQNKKDIKEMLSKNKLPEEGIYEDLLSKIFRVPITSIFEFMKLAKKYHDTPEYIKCKTLIIHGDEDEIVPISASVYAYNAIKHNKKSITFVKDVKHRVLISEKREEVTKYIIQYFKGGLRWKTVEKSEAIKEKFCLDLKKVKDSDSLENLRIKYSGKKSEISNIYSNLKNLNDLEKKNFGLEINELKNEIQSKINELKESFDLEKLNKKLNDETIDVSLPSTKINVGSTHPITKIIEEVESLFISMGYDVVDGPEVEQDKYNFEYLNIPKGHPVRDTQDSFFINEGWLLRTQTSPVQVRTMQNNLEKGPIKIICSGKVYRKDNDDATHSHQFTQIEGLVIGENISMSDLKGTLEIFAKNMFGKTREIRFRPSYFPFTEPSIEVDVSCFNCNKKGCSICKNTGWIEILGAGMVHPNVLKMSGYDSDKYTGFAFGMGAERIAMLKYRVPDVRMFYLNDIRFLKQFNRIEGDYK